MEAVDLGLASFPELIEARRDELIALTRDLIRMPTLNPPGEGYLEICEYLATRLRSRNFQIEMVRAHGTPGDSDRYPRWNVVARREGRTSGPCVHFNSHIDVVETGHGWTTDPFGGELKDGKIYGRGSCDMKGGLAASIIAVEAFIDTFPEFSGAIEISGTADEETGGYGALPTLRKRDFSTPAAFSMSSFPNRSTRIVSVLAIAVSGGLKSRQRVISLTARCRFWAIVRCATWGRFCRNSKRACIPHWHANIPPCPLCPRAHANQR